MDVPVYLNVELQLQEGILACCINMIGVKQKTNAETSAFLDFITGTNVNICRVKFRRQRSFCIPSARCPYYPNSSNPIIAKYQTGNSRGSRSNTKHSSSKCPKVSTNSSDSRQPIQTHKCWTLPKVSTNSSDSRQPIQTHKCR